MHSLTFIFLAWVIGFGACAFLVRERLCQALLNKNVPLLVGYYSLVLPIILIEESLTIEVPYFLGHSSDGNHFFDLLLLALSCSTHHKGQQLADNHPLWFIGMGERISARGTYSSDERFGLRDHEHSLLANLCGDGNTAILLCAKVFERTSIMKTIFVSSQS